jgi:hypothetical protein
MANDRLDFAPEIRNSAWWATDTRKAINGKAVEAILEKQGKKPLDDLSHIEAVQMGHVMQPVIGQLVTSKLDLEIRDADYSLTHPTEPWLRSHFDFISSDGKTLVEAKNYNAGARNKFDVDSNRVPLADYYQCLHEATVHNVDKVILAVLFGGQEFQSFEFTFTPDEKVEFVKEMAKLWAHVKLNTVPEAGSIEATKLVFPVSTEQTILASAQIEAMVSQLKEVRTRIKDMEGISETLELHIRNFMGDRGEIQSVDGSTLVTWKSSKASKRFNSDLFKQSMPDIYEQFVMETPGARRFLIK